MLKINNPFLACVNTAVFGGAQALMIALYPALALSLHTHLAVVINCVCVGTFLFLLGSPYWSNTTAYLSRRAVMLIGTGGLWLSFMWVISAVYLSENNIKLSIGLFLASQMIYGLIASATVPAAQAIQLQHATEQQTINASFLNTMSLNVGRIVGYLLMVFFYQNYTTVLLLYSVLITAALFLQIINYRHGSLYVVSKNQNSTWKDEIFSIRWIIVMAMLYACYLETLIFSLAEMIKNTLHVNTLLASSFSAKFLLWISLGIFVGQSMGKKYFKQAWQLGMSLGVFALLLGAIVLSHATSLPQFGVAISMMVIGLGLLPAFYLALLRTSEIGQRYGKRAGIVAVAHTLGYTGGGLLAGYLCGTSVLWVGNYLAVMALCLGLAVYQYQHQDKGFYEYGTSTH